MGLYPLGTRDEVLELYGLDEKGLEDQVRDFYRSMR